MIEISDIQFFPNGQVEITFQDVNGEDFLTIKISKEDCWDIHKFCKEKLSYYAQTKEKR